MAKKKLHVFHIQESLEVGGMENGIVNLVNNISKDQFRISLCCINNTGSLKNRIEDSSVKLQCLWQAEGISWFLPLRLARILKQEKVDIVHTHNFYSGLYGIIAARLAGVPVVIHGEHGTLILSKQIRIHAMRFFSLLVDKFFVVSSDLKNELMREIKIPNDKIDVLINGVDINRFKISTRGSILRESLGISPESFLIGSVGRLVPVKNFKLLLQVKKKLDTAGLNTSCLIVGSGSCREELECYARNIGTKILFLGERFDIPEILAILDLFVLTSLNEGMSNTILEAMACGKPVVATRVGGNSELVEENKTGFLISSNNSEELLEAIEKCVSNKELLLQFGRCARETVEQKFSLQAMVKGYESAYLTFAKKKGLLV